MELYSLRYNLYNYLIKDNFDYVSNKDYLFLWKNTLAILFIFIILIIVSHYNQIEVFSFFIIALIVFFLYIIYFEMKVTIDNYESNKHLLNYKNYYQLLNSIFIENYDFTIDDEINYQINKKQISLKNFDDLFKPVNMPYLIRDNKNKYEGYISVSENKHNYLYLKIKNHEMDDDTIISPTQIFTNNNYHLYNTQLITTVEPNELHLEIDDLSRKQEKLPITEILNPISKIYKQLILNNPATDRYSIITLNNLNYLRIKINLETDIFFTELYKKTDYYLIEKSSLVSTANNKLTLTIPAFDDTEFISLSNKINTFNERVRLDPTLASTLLINDESSILTAIKNDAVIKEYNQYQLQTKRLIGLNINLQDKGEINNIKYIKINFNIATLYRYNIKSKYNFRIHSYFIGIFDYVYNNRNLYADATNSNILHLFTFNPGSLPNNFSKLYDGTTATIFFNKNIQQTFNEKQINIYITNDFYNNILKSSSSLNLNQNIEKILEIIYYIKNDTLSFYTYNGKKFAKIGLFTNIENDPVYKNSLYSTFKSYLKPLILQNYSRFNESRSLMIETFVTATNPITNQHSMIINTNNIDNIINDDTNRGIIIHIELDLIDNPHYAQKIIGLEQILATIFNGLKSTKISSLSTTKYTDFYLNISLNYINQVISAKTYLHYILEDIDNTFMDKYKLIDLIKNNPGITNNMYIKLKETEVTNQKLANFPYLKSLIFNLIDNFNNDKISKSYNKFMDYAYKSPDQRITDFFSSYFNIKQKIKNAIKYNENKTNEEINDNYYINLINNRDILKYIDVYNDDDILKIKNYIFIRKEKGNEKSFNKFLLNYNEKNDDYILLNEKGSSPEMLKSALIKKITLEGYAEPYEYYLINLNDMNNIRKDNNSNFNFMKEFIKNLNYKYNENYENFDIIYKTPNVNQNKEILNIVDNFNYIYIKLLILIIIIIAIIMHAFYKEYMRYLR